MFKALWGEIQQGQLARLPYLGYSLLLSLLGIGIGIAVGVAIGITETMMGGELADTQAQLADSLSLPALLVLVVVFVLLSFAGLNLMAKRLRHMGLPGWPTAIALTLLVAAISYGWTAQAANGFQLLVWLILALVPGGLFGRSEG
ncbi:hypothetical protein [Ferrimonas balearica]|uniref:DUF805 domain-containing protein n=1 Tax=Ferrimonas balearica TaxID=44012 RepID=UPI001C993539|nr:hypothetical protein [Ferrimonas balearica]MBY5991310.1 hypothetical protein [Ferrimonas balearica]